MLLAPGGGDPRQGHQGRDVRPLGHAHRPARLVDGDLDAEAGERLDEHAHRRQRAMVDHGAGPVEDDGLQVRKRVVHVAQLSAIRSSMTSSAMAKEVLAPVPLVITTSRTASAGRSTSISRSGAEA